MQEVKRDEQFEDAATEGQSEEAVNEPVENQEAVNTITLLRIYDVVLGIYAEFNEERASQLWEAHQNGELFGSSPALK